MPKRAVVTWETDDGDYLIWGTSNTLKAFSAYIGHMQVQTDAELADRDIISAREFEKAPLRWAPKDYLFQEEWDMSKVKNHWWPGYVPYLFVRY